MLACMRQILVDSEGELELRTLNIPSGQINSGSKWFSLDARPVLLNNLRLFLLFAVICHVRLYAPYFGYFKVALLALCLRTLNNSSGQIHSGSEWFSLDAHQCG